MGIFTTIKRALAYIDDNLDESVGYESLAAMFHFSPYYFHRMFTLTVGKTVAAHIRDRRLLRACRALCETDASVLRIGIDCGYPSQQSFCRAFKASFGISPSTYRRAGHMPIVETVDEMIMRFTNRVKGGVLVNPRIIKKEALHIAGVAGDGGKTAEVWGKFERLCREKPLYGKRTEDGYEVRLFQDGECTVHMGHAVRDPGRVDAAYTVFSLPPSRYASFDVYVANGYDSENGAMTSWLEANGEGYAERLLGEAHYCVEFYDERFRGDEAGSIVEIWIPIEKQG